MKYTYEQVKQEFENKGYILISTEYHNVKEPLKFICKKHKHRGLQEIRYSNFISGRGCAYCMFEEGHAPNHLQEIIYKEEAEKMGYIFNSIEFVNGRAIINFICPKHKNKGIQKANWSSIRAKKCSCSYCNGTRRSTDDFKQMVYRINPNVEILGEYLGARKRILCRCCIDGHTWNPYAYNLLSGYGCPECSCKLIGMKKRTSVDSKMLKLKEKHPNIDFLSKPVLTNDYVKCRCKVCGHEWEASYSNLTKHQKATGCPKCAGSNSEQLVSSILDKWGYDYEKQKKYIDCNDTFSLPFDFYLLDFNILIEFDGEHHYHPIPRGKSDGIKEFEEVLKHDKIKNEYCKEKNIPLIRIPYWERDDLEYFLFEEFVKLNVIEEIKLA